MKDEWKARPMSHAEICGLEYARPLPEIRRFNDLFFGRSRALHCGEFAIVARWSPEDGRWLLERCADVRGDSGLYNRLVRETRARHGPGPWSHVRIFEHRCRRDEIEPFLERFGAPPVGRVFDDGHLRRAVRELFEAWSRARVAFSTGCFFLGSPHEYYLVPCDGALVGAHRLVFEYCYGRLPDGLMVLHSCDVRGCFRPSHLRPGTHADNMADKAERGRWFRSERERRAHDERRLRI